MDLRPLSHSGRSIGWSGAYLVASRGSALIAVPLLLDRLGADVYAAWVLASALVYSQSLVDFGFTAAITRFVALGAADGSRHAVTIVIRRGVVFYSVVSAASLAVVLGASRLAGELDYLSGDEIEEAANLLRYGGLAFVLTNATMLFATSLQGLDRVDAAFKAQTIGALTFLPLLIGGLGLGWSSHAAGMALVGSTALQACLLVPPLLSAVRTLPRGAAQPPRLSTMLATGVRWQVSALADFATFQLPRLVSAVALSSSTVVVVDLALRYGQAAAAPLFALYPLVLPRAARAWRHSGLTGIRELAQPWVRAGLPYVLAGSAIAVPVTSDLIETWAGSSLTQSEAVIATAIVAGALAHASTGLLTGALLAANELRPVIAYKLGQLVLGVVLVGAGAVTDELVLGLGLAVALCVPAVWFNRSAAAIVGISLRLQRPVLLAGLYPLLMLIPMLILVGPSMSSGVALASALALGVIAAGPLVRLLHFSPAGTAGGPRGN